MSIILRDLALKLLSPRYPTIYCSKTLLTRGGAIISFTILPLLYCHCCSIMTFTAQHLHVLLEMFSPYQCHYLKNSTDTLCTTFSNYLRGFRCHETPAAFHVFFLSWVAKTQRNHWTKLSVW